MLNSRVNLSNEASSSKASSSKARCFRSSDNWQERSFSRLIPILNSDLGKGRYRSPRSRMNFASSQTVYVSSIDKEISEKRDLFEYQNKVKKFLCDKEVADDNATPGSFVPEHTSPPTFKRLANAIKNEDYQKIKEWLNDKKQVKYRIGEDNIKCPRMTGYDQETGKTLLQLLIENWSENPCQVELFYDLLNFGASPMALQFRESGEAGEAGEAGESGETNPIETAVNSINFQNGILLGAMISIPIATKNREEKPYDILSVKPAYRYNGKAYSLIEWAKLRNEKCADYEERRNMDTAFCAIAHAFFNKIFSNRYAKENENANANERAYEIVKVVNEVQNLGVSLTDFFSVTGYRKEYKNKHNIELAPLFSKTLTHRLGCDRYFNDCMFDIMDVENGALERDNFKSLYKTVVEQACLNELVNRRYRHARALVDISSLHSFTLRFLEKNKTLRTSSHSDAFLDDASVASMLVQDGLMPCCRCIPPEKFDVMENFFRLVIDKVMKQGLNENKDAELDYDLLREAKDAISSSLTSSKLIDLWNSNFIAAGRFIKFAHLIPKGELANTIMNGVFYEDIQKGLDALQVNYVLP